MNNVVFIIPTGIGCKIGGHAGDATPAARLIAETCDKLILHPNVVNASDINEMPANALYVEGSMLDRFLWGKGLSEVRSNRIAVAVNEDVSPDIINAVSASRATTGINAEIVVLKEPLKMKGWVHNNNNATGEHSGVQSLIRQFTGSRGKYNALAIVTEIEVDEGVALKYFIIGGVNPWGGIEAMVSRMVAEALCIPVAHAPVESTATKQTPELLNLPYTEVADPRMAAEIMAVGYSHCVLKGLHRAPQYGDQITNESVIAMVTPTNCIGSAHRACINKGIPIIAVEENDCCWNQRLESIIYVDSYVEAAGMISLIKAGLTLDSVRRVGPTVVKVPTSK